MGRKVLSIMFFFSCVLKVILLNESLFFWSSCSREVVFIRFFFRGDFNYGFSWDSYFFRKCIIFSLKEI